MQPSFINIPELVSSLIGVLRSITNDDGPRFMIVWWGVDVKENGDTSVGLISTASEDECEAAIHALANRPDPEQKPTTGVTIQ